MKHGSIDDEQRLRERLFDVLAEFPVLYQARQGVGSKILNPFDSLDQVVRSHVNPLMLYINDLLQEIQKGLSLMEALDSVIRFALRCKYRDRVLEAVRQLSKIEGERPYFLWGLASLLNSPHPALRTQRLKSLHRRLHLMNRHYTQQFGGLEDDIDLIPWRVEFRDQVDGVTEGTYEYPTQQQLEIFRTALAALLRIDQEHRSDQWIQRKMSRKIRDEITELAEILFDYGYTVKEICGRVRDEEAFLPRFLNNMLLDELEKTVSRKMTLKDISRHIILLTHLDCSVVIPFRTFYRRLTDTKEALESAKEIERKEGIKKSHFRRLLKLYQRYQKVESNILIHYLSFQFSRAHGDYLPLREVGHFGVELTTKFFLRYYDTEETEKKAEEAALKVYSSKASGEMLEVLRLLIRALSEPDKIRGRRVHILGHIQSGAMGRVLIGIHKGSIVALKEAKAPKESSMPLSDATRLMEYEAKILEHVQSGPAQHENIVEFFGLVEEEGRRFLAIGYHPAETLSALMRKAGAAPTVTGTDRQRPLTVADIKTLSLQMLRVLIHLKERQVIHRDLKPANILYLLDKDGQISLSKVIDFGVAVGLAPDLPKDIHRKQIVGTLGYMAPEMVFREASYASDLYCTGVLFYQLLSGKLPLNLEPTTDAEGLRKMLKRVVQEDRMPLVTANPSLSDQAYLSATTELVDRMIARDPTKRPAVEDCFNEWAALWNDVPYSALASPIEYCP